MIDRLRIFWHRPLDDTARRGLFALAAAAIVAAAIAFALLGRATLTPTARPDRAAAQPQPAASYAPAVIGQLSPAPPARASSATQPPSEEAPAPETPVTRGALTAARSAARRFLSGYLPYSYGQRQARTIAAASAPLRRRLAQQPPRVPPAERRRRARVLLLETSSAAPAAAAIRALIGDGTRRYTLDLRLARSHRHWTVTDIQA